MKDEAKCADLLNHNTESSPSFSRFITQLLVFQHDERCRVNWDGGFLPQMSHPLFEKHLQLRR